MSFRDSFFKKGFLDIIKKGFLDIIMKRKIIAALLAGTLTLSLFGCGNSKNSDTTTGETTSADKEEDTTEAETLDFYEIGGKNHVDVADYSEYVKIGNYTGFEINVTKSKDVETQLKEYIESTIKSNTKYEGKITDRVVAEDDKINMDYCGRLNGVAFDKGSATNSDYTIHGGFIEDLDKQLVGLECGKEYELKVKFPDNYTSNADLAGKETVFTVKVNYIYEKTVPEWNDEFANTLTSGKYTTIETLEEELRKEIDKYNEETQASSFSEGIWTEILKQTEFVSYPEEKLEKNAEQYFKQRQESFKSQAENYSMKYEEVLSYYGYKDDAALKEACMKSAKQELEYIMVACIIADKEEIRVTDDIYNKLVNSIISSSSSTYENQEAFEKEYGIDYIMESFILEGVSSWLKDKNTMKLVDSAEEVVSTEAAKATE